MYLRKLGKNSNMYSGMILYKVCNKNYSTHMSCLLYRWTSFSKNAPRFTTYSSKASNIRRLREMGYHFVQDYSEGEFIVPLLIMSTRY